MRCIYCLKQKNEAKRVEHIVPQSFGVFRHNFVLDNIVCDTCNQFFGDTLEIFLARDTLEGTSRYDFNVKKPVEFKSLGKNSRLIIRISEGFFKGSYAYRDYSPQEGRVVVKPIPQVGFLKTGSTSYEYFLLDKIPLFDSLQKRFYNLDDQKGIIILGCNSAIADTILKKKGFSFKMKGEFDCPESAGPGWLCDVEGTIDQVILRAIAKIGFNYLAYWAGTDFVMHESFNAIRTFVLTGEKGDYPLIRAVDKAILFDEVNSAKRRLGHIVTVNWAGDKVSILSQISLFNWFNYQVILALNFPDERPRITKGHFFDVHNHVILELGTKKIK